MAEDNVKAQMRKGILEYCILAILSREDSYAPKIIAELKQAEMIVVEGTLYPILTRQKNAGLLTYRWEESPQGPPRKYYTLTEKGREYLTTLDEAWDELVRTESASFVTANNKKPQKITTMKKILLIAVLLGAMLSVTVYFVCIAAPSVFFGKGLKGSGNIVTRTIEAPAFDRIDAARAVKVVITDKTSGKITIAADDNVMDYVVVEANGGRLTATIDKSINNLSNADVTVTVPANGSIRALDASSAAKISSDVVLNADKFAMDASSAAKIDVSVKAQSCAVAASSASKINASVEAVSCSVEASSASKITLKGSAAKCTADLSSASKLSAGDFVAAECSVNTSSAAKAVVNCTERLHADASSGSSIRYSGDCRTSINKSSGGSVGRN